MKIITFNRIISNLILSGCKAAVCVCALFISSTAVSQEAIEWNFNKAGDNESWNIIDGNHSVENGYLSFVPTARTAKLTKGVDIKASEYKYLTVRLKNTDVNGLAAISYRSSDGPNAGAYNKPFTFEITTRDISFKEYVINLHDLPYWKGTIHALMIELPARPSVGSNQIIDYIKITKEGENAVIRKIPDVNKTDSLSIVKFYNSFNGSSWASNENWLTTNKLDDWFGVDVDYSSYDSRVTRLSLKNNNLQSGDICLRNLTELEYLNLDENNLSDLSSIADMRNIDTLSVINNKLSIPQLIALKACVSSSKSQYRYSPQKPFELSVDGNTISAIAVGDQSDNIYTWFDLSNTKVHEATGNPAYTPAVSGDYYVKVTNPRLPELTLISSNGYSSINSDSEGTISVYPNPANNFFYVDNASNSTVSFYNASGTLKFQTPITSDHERISIDNIQSGAYYITVRDNTGRQKSIESYKIIVF